MSTIPFDVPPLGGPLSLDKAGRRLTVKLPSGRLQLHAQFVNDPRPSSIRRLVKTGEPGVVIAPLLTRQTKQILEAAGWSWIDASGSARIQKGSAFVHIERPPTAVRTRSRLSVPPQGERIVRLLLDTYPEALRVADIARNAALDKGYTSRILKRLRELGMVTYERRTPVEVPYPVELFELWRRAPRRTLESMWFVSAPRELNRVAAQIQRLAKPGVAFSGAFAASLLVGYLEPERVECYATDLRTIATVGDALGGERVTRGANVLFLSHRDPGVLTVGTSTTTALTIVSRSQIYRDMLDRGRGRELELASEFRKRALRW